MPKLSCCCSILLFAKTAIPNNNCPYYNISNNEIWAIIKFSPFIPRINPPKDLSEKTE